MRGREVKHSYKQVKKRVNVASRFEGQLELFEGVCEASRSFKKKFMKTRGKNFLKKKLKLIEKKIGERE